MRERGKAVEAYDFADFNYSCSSSDMPCKKHPCSSSVGICAFCLKDRLVNLVCSECGEQRFSSCSCSDFSSSYRNSSCTADVGSVGRMSFLIENEKSDLQNSNPKSKRGEINKADEVILLRRSASSCVEAKKYKGIWKIKRLFRKKKVKGFEKNDGFDDKSSDVWVSDIMKVSRSRSLCSFRGGGFNDTDDQGSDYRFSSAKISDFTGGILFDYDKQQSGFISESEPRRSGFRGVSDFTESRKIGFRGGLIDDQESRKSGFIGGQMDDQEPRKSGFRGGLMGDQEPRKSGFRGGLMDDQELRKSGFRGGLMDDQEPRKSGFRGGLIDDQEPRKSGFRGLMDDQEPQKSGFREAENGGLKKIGGAMELESTCSVPNGSIFPVKESDFKVMDESAFIDLKLDLLSSEEFLTMKINNEASNNGNVSLRNEPRISLKHTGSCRITFDNNNNNNRELKRGSNSSYNIWKWFSRNHSGRKSISKKDGN